MLKAVLCLGCSEHGTALVRANALAPSTYALQSLWTLRTQFCSITLRFSNQWAAHGKWRCTSLPEVPYRSDKQLNRTATWVLASFHPPWSFHYRLNFSLQTYCWSLCLSAWLSIIFSLLITCTESAKKSSFHDLHNKLQKAVQILVNKSTTAIRLLRNVTHTHQNLCPLLHYRFAIPKWNFASFGPVSSSPLPETRQN